MRFTWCSKTRYGVDPPGTVPAGRLCGRTGTVQARLEYGPLATVTPNDVHVMARATTEAHREHPPESTPSQVAHDLRLAELAAHRLIRQGRDDAIGGRAGLGGKQVVPIERQ
jgi:hypothetical protein